MLRCCNNGIAAYLTPTNYTHKENVRAMRHDICRCKARSRRLNLNMASTLMKKVLLQITNQGLLLPNVAEKS